MFRVAGVTPPPSPDARARAIDQDQPIAKRTRTRTETTLKIRSARPGAARSRRGLRSGNASIHSPVVNFRVVGVELARRSVILALQTDQCSHSANYSIDCPI